MALAFGAMQASKPWVRISRGGAIQAGFELLGERVYGHAVGTWRTSGRHHAGPDLAHGLFPTIGIFAGIREIQLVQHQTGGLDLLVMAGDAIAIEQRLFGRLRLGARALFDARHCGDRQHTDDGDRSIHS